MAGEERDRRRFLLESWLDLGEAVEEHPELRRLLFDPVTGMPTAPLLFPRIQSLLEECGEVSLLCVNVVRYSRLEQIFGWQVFDQVMCTIAEVLEETAGEELRDSDVMAELMNSGNAFVVVLSPPRTVDRIDPAALIVLARRVEATLNRKLAERLDATLLEKLMCYVGSATASRSDDVRLEELVFAALEEALEDSKARLSAGNLERASRLRSVLDGDRIHTLVHPLFDLEAMRIVGYEALSRGPKDSEFEHPDALFSTAYGADMVMRLERVCREKALELAEALPDGKLLFLNIEPDAVGDPRLREIATGEWSSPVEPSQIVLELSESTASADFAAFRSTLDYVRALGFRVAVDDAGSGYPSIRSLQEVRPEWVKIDMALVRGCDRDDVKAALIRALVVFAHKVGAMLVATGIETQAELAKLRELGVRYGQGFLLAPLSAGFMDEEELAAYFSNRSSGGTSA